MNAHPGGVMPRQELKRDPATGAINYDQFHSCQTQDMIVAIIEALEKMKAKDRCSFPAAAEFCPICAAHSTLIEGLERAKAKRDAWLEGKGP